ncbi:hypothetical protein DFJ73DRAFT_956438 [Zopfochytrium polystomum]|nr:hypothetical protein DFJ73DRAFT_956438 [Zopfochytrium polystomum]
MSSSSTGQSSPPPTSTSTATTEVTTPPPPPQLTTAPSSPSPSPSPSPPSCDPWRLKACGDDAVVPGMPVFAPTITILNAVALVLALATLASCILHRRRRAAARKISAPTIGRLEVFICIYTASCATSLPALALSTVFNTSYLLYHSLITLSEVLIFLGILYYLDLVLRAAPIQTPQDRFLRFRVLPFVPTPAVLAALIVFASPAAANNPDAGFALLLAFDALRFVAEAAAGAFLAYAAVWQMRLLDGAEAGFDPHPSGVSHSFASSSSATVSAHTATNPPAAGQWSSSSSSSAMTTTATAADNNTVGAADIPRPSRRSGSRHHRRSLHRHRSLRRARSPSATSSSTWRARRRAWLFSPAVDRWMPPNPALSLRPGDEVLDALREVVATLLWLAVGLALVTSSHLVSTALDIARLQTGSASAYGPFLIGSCFCSAILARRVHLALAPPPTTTDVDAVHDAHHPSSSSADHNHHRHHLQRPVGASASALELGTTGAMQLRPDAAGGAHAYSGNPGGGGGYVAYAPPPPQQQQSVSSSASASAASSAASTAVYAFPAAVRRPSLGYGGDAGGGAGYYAGAGGGVLPYAVAGGGSGGVGMFAYPPPPQHGATVKYGLG